MNQEPCPHVNVLELLAYANKIQWAKCEDCGADLERDGTGPWRPSRWAAWASEKE